MSGIKKYKSELGLNLYLKYVDYGVRMRVNFPDEIADIMMSYLIDVSGGYVCYDGKREGYQCRPSSSGKTIIKCFYHNGLLEGSHSILRDNGTIIEQSWRTAGNYDGLHVRYYLDGKVSVIEIYVNNLRHGISRYYREDGSLKSTISYCMGKMHGPYIEYYKTAGCKYREYTYVQNVCRGTYRVWRPDGRLIVDCNV